MNQELINMNDTIVPNSDQMNADDLVGGSRDILITGVTRYDGNKFNLHYENDSGRPYKPCLTMRKIIIAAWGENANKWIGCSLTLFNEPTVKYAGKAVGGIRISHMSNIQGPFEMSLNETRGKKRLYKIGLLTQQEKPMYNENQFQSDLPAIQNAINSGTTPEQIINQCESSAKLSEQQLAVIRNLKPTKGS